MPTKSGKKLQRLILTNGHALRVCNVIISHYESMRGLHVVLELSLNSERAHQL